MIRRWLPPVGFGLLALATPAAFFLVQALKTSNPLVWFSPPPLPTPAVFDPIHGRPCRNIHGVPLDYRRTQIKFEISSTTPVGVYIVSAGNAGGPAVATIASGVPMRRSVPGTHQWYPRTFTWNGLLDDGEIAPDGTYYFRIVLEKQDRSINLSEAPVQVLTQPVQARVTGVTLLGQGTSTQPSTQTGTTGTTVTTSTTSTTSTQTGTETGTQTSTQTSTQPGAGALVFTPPHGTLKISYTRGHYRRLWVYVYRTDVNGKPQQVARIPADRTGSWARWPGEIDGQPAPAGTYLFGLIAQNLACDRSSWPVALPPAPGTTPHAGVSIRYLTVTPPLTPTVSGSRTDVAVYSPDAGYAWTLRASGTTRILAHGRGAVGSSRISVRMPRRHPGLYTLVVRSGTQIAAVPLVASQAGAAAARARVLVVLPMLSWMGGSPVDDTGDGLPDTLTRGDAVALDRPLVDGPPASVAADAALLAYLKAQHLPYQLTTDVALTEGRGPSLVDRWGVLFADGEQFIPASLAATMRGYVRAGARVLILGTRALRGTSSLSGSLPVVSAAAPVTSAVDPFGAQHGPLTPTGGELITELTDQLGLLAYTPAFSGFTHYQPIEPPRSSAVSAAGIGDQSAAIVGFQYGSGIVMEVGLPDFSASLSGNIDSQELISSAWRILAKQS